MIAKCWQVWRIHLEQTFRTSFQDGVPRRG
jgi:hypothetical protein